MDRSTRFEALDAPQRVAFFGGSFDPPHLGHLAIARAARDGLKLDKVLFAPVGAQPLKPLGSTAAFEDRVAMTRLAIAEEPGFALSLLDAPDPDGKPNYTLETLEPAACRARVPGRTFLPDGRRLVRESAEMARVGGHPICRNIDSCFAAGTASR